MQNKNEHRLIVSSDSVLVLSPLLAQIVGKTPAIVLQQLHYWLSHEKNYGYQKDGVRWIYNTYTQWQEQIKFISTKTIQRSFAKLEELGFVLSESKSRSSYDKTKAYTICYKKINVIDEEILDKKLMKKSVRKFNDNKHTIENTHLDKMSSSNESKCPNLNIKNKQTKINNSSSNVFKNISDVNRNKTQMFSEEENKYFEEMIVTWNSIIEQEPAKIKKTQHRLNQLKIVYSYFEERLEIWNNYCKKIATSKFLMGEISPFRINFDWAIKLETIERVLNNQFTFGDRIPPQKQDTSEGGGGEAINTNTIPFTPRNKRNLKNTKALKTKA